MRLNMEELGTHRVNSPTKLTVEVAILGDVAGMKLCFMEKLTEECFQISL